MDTGRPVGQQEVEAPRIARQSAHECGKVVSRTHRPPLHSADIPGALFCYRLSLSKGYIVSERIKSSKHPNEPIGNRTHDLSACSAVPQHERKWVVIQ
jgi:hypothetical protein